MDGLDGQHAPAPRGHEGYEHLRLRHQDARSDVRRHDGLLRTALRWPGNAYHIASDPQHEAKSLSAVASRTIGWVFRSPQEAYTAQSPLRCAFSDQPLCAAGPEPCRCRCRSSGRSVRWRGFVISSMCPHNLPSALPRIYGSGTGRHVATVTMSQARRSFMGYIVKCSLRNGAVLCD